MTGPNARILMADLKHLRPPTVPAEYEKPARDAAARDEPDEAYPPTLTELEVAARSARAVAAEAKGAGAGPGRVGEAAN